MRDTLRSPRQIVLRTELRALRERQGLSQATVARRLGKHQSFVSKYEKGERRLSVIEFIDVVRALGGEPATVLRRFTPAIDAPVPKRLPSSCHQADISIALCSARLGAMASTTADSPCASPPLSHEVVELMAAHRSAGKGPAPYGTR